MLSKVALLVKDVQKMLKGDLSRQVPYTFGNCSTSKLSDKGFGPSLSNSVFKGGVVWACCQERVLTGTHRKEAA